MANKRFGDYPIRVTPLADDAILIEGEQIGEYHRLLLSDLPAAVSAEPGPLRASSLEVLGQAWTPPVELVDEETIATDAALSNVFRVTLEGDRTLANPTNLKDGSTIIWRIKQDAVGGRTLAFGNAFIWPDDGTPPTLKPEPNARTVIVGIVDGADILVNSNLFP